MSVRPTSIGSDRARRAARPDRLIRSLEGVRALAVEAIGTGILVAVVIGSGIMAERLAGGNAAVALLGNTLATVAVLPVLILIFAPISGAHFNPAVTLYFALRGRLPAALAAAYLPVQIAGGIAGTFLAHLMFALPLLQTASHIRSGPGQWLGEFVATLCLLGTIVGSMRHRPEATPYAVGLVIGAGYWFTSSTSFANPAVTIARSLSDSFAGIRPLDVPGFIVAQLLAAGLAALCLPWLFPEQVERRTMAPSAES
jgi:glycerol uptake facilitator-like aquaporin